MADWRKLTTALGIGVLAWWAAGSAMAQPARETLACDSPPTEHCPATNCPAKLIGHLGNVVDHKTKRKFFLDYPCDLKPGEKVTFILNLHSGGSIGNWQRHYFPAMDLKEKYRLVVATPSGVVRGWVHATDDAHLQNIVDIVYAKFGAENIRGFWLAGHSQGGLTAGVLMCTEFFRDKADGWLSLSGGRAATPLDAVRMRKTVGSSAPVIASPATERPNSTPNRAEIVNGSMPKCKFSHIYSSGEHELPSSGLPTGSRWAEHLKCGARTRRPDIVDSKPGYVYDARDLENPTPEWGGKPRPGTAQVYVYPDCADGRVVADIVRMNKGHTEGLEPNVTEEIVKLMLSAPSR